MRKPWPMLSTPFSTEGPHSQAVWSGDSEASVLTCGSCHVGAAPAPGQEGPARPGFGEAPRARSRAWVVGGESSRGSEKGWAARPGQLLGTGVARTEPGEALAGPEVGGSAAGCTEGDLGREPRLSIQTVTEAGPGGALPRSPGSTRGTCVLQAPGAGLAGGAVWGLGGSGGTLCGLRQCGHLGRSRCTSLEVVCGPVGVPWNRVECPRSPWSGRGTPTAPTWQPCHPCWALGVPCVVSPAEVTTDRSLVGSQMAVLAGSQNSSPEELAHQEPWPLTSAACVTDGPGSGLQQVLLTRGRVSRPGSLLPRLVLGPCSRRPPGACHPIATGAGCLFGSLGPLFLTESSSILRGVQGWAHAMSSRNSPSELG